MDIRPLQDEDREWVQRLITERWGAPLVVGRGRSWNPVELPGFAAFEGERCVGLVTYELDGRTRFTALVPETSFYDGENDVGIYAVSGSEGAFRLSRLGGTRASTDALVKAAALSPQGAKQPRRP